MSKFEPYLALEASAGSGKTYALSVRYISLLYLGASPSKILTLTFTNKAAAEMKSRICETLKKLEDTSELESISEQVGLTCKELIEKKEEVLEKFLKDDLLISTIDSFFARILRKFALNAGFMPDFKIETNPLEYEVLEKFLRICIQEKKYSSLLKFSINEQKKLSDIFTLLNEFYDKESEFEPTKVAKALHVKVDEVLSIMNELKELYTKEGAGASILKTFEATNINEIMKKGYLAKEDLNYWHYKKYTRPEANELLDELKEVLSRFLNEREKYLLGELGELFNIYKHTLRSLNKENSTLSFSDVTNALYSLLKDEISKDFLYFRLDGKIEHILIDEFQDTNIMQYKILSPLMSEVVSGVGSSEFKSLFFVGDIKQSIYRFRGGAKELFKHARTQFGVKEDVLEYNYRSSKNVVEYVNKTFLHVINDYKAQLVKNVEKEGFVEVCFNEDVQQNVLEKLEFYLAQGVEAKDIAILVHQNKDAKVIRDMVHENIKDINVQTEATIKLISVDVVAAIIDLLKYAYFKDEIYKHNFLSFFGLNWSEKLDIAWLNLNKTPTSMIISIVKRFEIFEDDMDVIKLVELSGRYVDIESFIFECDEFADVAKSEDNDGVKILTIHKSKGLEFDHVIVADRLGSKRGGGGTLLYEYEDINLQGIYQRVSSREFVDERYAIAKDKEEILAKEDILNMHYVAFTRAQNSLIICAKEQKSAFELLSLEESLLGKVQIKDKKQKTKNSLLSMQEELESYGLQENTKADEEDSSETQHFAIEYGLAMHFCLEMMSQFTEDSLKNAYISMYNRYRVILSEQSLNEIYKRVELLINDKKFLSLIEGGVLLREQPIAYEGERKQIDLLIEKEDELIVIDYKSSLHVSDFHLAQVGLYKKAMNKIYSKKVSAYLVYLRDDEVELKNL